MHGNRYAGVDVIIAGLFGARNATVAVCAIQAQRRWFPGREDTVRASAEGYRPTQVASILSQGPGTTQEAWLAPIRVQKTVQHV